MLARIVTSMWPVLRWPGEQCVQGKVLSSVWEGPGEKCQGMKTRQVDPWARPSDSMLLLLLLLLLLRRFSRVRLCATS